ncbi:MAG TPA: hypothetical protein PLB02_07570 [Thermoanaerobaculia bacterium]|nr:hypothetical protein [Thermoanaerobaculia bacterium]
MGRAPPRRPRRRGGGPRRVPPDRGQGPRRDRRERRGDRDPAPDEAHRDKGFGHFHHTAYNLANAWALLGRTPQALAFLREAAETGFPCYPLFEKDPFLDRLRNDPGFRTFLEAQRSDWEGRRKLVATR